MARRPTRSLAAQAREAARVDALPLRFVEDYDHVETTVTTAYKKGMVLTVPMAHRRGALARGKAVVDGN